MGFPREPLRPRAREWRWAHLGDPHNFLKTHKMTGAVEARNGTGCMVSRWPWIGFVPG